MKMYKFLEIRKNNYMKKAKITIKFIYQDLSSKLKMLQKDKQLLYGQIKK